MRHLAGTTTLVRLAARRERLRVLAFVLIAVIIVATTAAQSDAAYPTRADREAYAAGVDANPGVIAMIGAPENLLTVGGDVAWQLGGFGAVGAALMAMFMVGRHTRAEEQSGRSELVAAAPVGRHAPLTAALIVAAASQLLLGLSVTLTMVAYGEPTGALAFGMSIASGGLVFAGFAAAAMQLSQTTSSAYGIVGGLLGAAYLVRAAGDVGNGTLSWLSPIGWTQAVRPYADGRWWPLALPVAAASVFAVTAYWLRGRRDDGAGVAAPRPGPAHADRALQGVFGLALRLQRGLLIGWTVGFLVGGMARGLTGRDAKALGGDFNYDEFIGSSSGDIVDQYYALSMLSMALIGTGFALQATLRMRREETAGRLEPLLATTASRRRWMSAQVAIAVAGSVLILLAAGLGAGVTDALNGGGAAQVARLSAAALVSAPAVWVLIGVAAALVGLAPRAAGAAWAVLAGCLLLTLLGPLLGLPGWMVDLSPFKHVPALPSADFRLAPVAVLTVIAAGLTMCGIAGFARRDVPR